MRFFPATKVDYYNLVFSNYGVDRNWKWNFMSFFECLIKIVIEMTTDH